MNAETPRRSTHPTSTREFGPFAERHIGPSAEDRAKMLAACGFGSLDELVAAAVPASIRDEHPVALPPPLAEEEARATLRELAARNQPRRQMIGLGYYDTLTPSVIQRNVLENPAWYTAYTPYQPEISQGRLEALTNFQTVVADLTGLPVAGASLLDEATAAAEGMTLVRRTNRASRSARFLVDADCLPQTIAVLRTRAEPLGIEIVVTDLSDGLSADLLADGGFGLLLQYPGASGAVRDHTALVETAHAHDIQVIVAADLLGLALLRPPGEIGADVAVGSAQRFGVPLMYGGPHAGYMAVRPGLERSLPGRLVGVSVDAAGRPAYRLALQTREQHIRREKATSNICTAQVLLAVIAGLYAVYHGPDGLRAIAERTHRFARALGAGLRRGGVELVSDAYFDTVQAVVPGRAAEIVAEAHRLGVNLWLADADHVGIACDETTTARDLAVLWQVFGVEPYDVDQLGDEAELPDGLLRTSTYLTHPVFHHHRSETAMLRYLRGLADDDYALDRGMIPLGSCTMKLNPTTAMEPITWPEFAGIHPFAPVEDAAGYIDLIQELGEWLAEMTGYAAVSLQPNAGSQGELAGLLAIRAYHRDRGDTDRDVCLIPSSAHGTNAASAVMAGMRVAVVAAAEDGTVDLGDLRAKLEQHAGRVAAIMVTYPSTHGVYEAEIRELCDLVHAAGGQVYVDGANLNALLGLAKVGEFGGDVSHLNLHKTFCIPHGGGGPGVGPVAAREHLAPYLPTHPMLVREGSGSPETGVGPVSGAPFGSAGILPISWAYVAMMGPAGLRIATETAVLAANYVAHRLAPHFPVLYSGGDGLVAHECIIDLRPLAKQTGCTVDDVAKRLIDYGFHAPTMSFPVAGTLMVEPTESEDLAELDRFCDAMIAIRAEIDEFSAGKWPADDNPLRNAPHTIEMLTGTWEHPYTREQAAYPVPTLRRRKYWSPVRRIDQAYGDRNLVCVCPPPDAFVE